MIYFIEQWNPTEKWLSLNLDERTNYLQNVTNAITDLVSQGVKILTWSVNDKNTSYRGDFNYFAVWAFPNEKIVKTFQSTVENAGWYQYFDQVNLMGTQDSYENVFNMLIDSKGK